MKKLIFLIVCFLLSVVIMGCPKTKKTVPPQKKQSETFRLLEDMRQQYNSSVNKWLETNSSKVESILANDKLKVNELEAELKKIKPTELDLTQLVLNMHNVSTSEDLIEAYYNQFNLDIFRSSPTEKQIPLVKVLIKPFLDLATISNTMYTANRIGSLGASDWQAQFRRGMILLHIGAITGWRLHPQDKKVIENIKTIAASIKPGPKPAETEFTEEEDTELLIRSMLHSMIERKARLSQPDNTARFLISAFQNASRLDAEQAAPHYMLGLSYWHAGDLENALAEIEAGNKCAKLNWPLIPPQPNAEASVEEQLKAADLFLRYQPPGTGIKRSSRHLLVAAGIWSSPEKVNAVLKMWQRLIDLNGPIGDWATLNCADSLALYAYLQEYRSDLLKYKLSSQQLEDWKKPMEYLKDSFTVKNKYRMMLKSPQEFWQAVHQQIEDRRKIIKATLNLAN